MNEELNNLEKDIVKQSQIFNDIANELISSVIDGVSPLALLEKGLFRFIFLIFFFIH